MALPAAVTDTIRRERDLLIQDLSKAADQLKAVGWTRHKHKDRQNDASLARLPFKAAQIAEKEGAAFEFCFHDPLTLLKSKTFLGHLLETLPRAGSTSYCLWASADLDNFKVVNDQWSHAHGDLAIILACQCVDDEVRNWNLAQTNAGFHADAMRFGGDEIALAITMPSASQGPPKEARELLDNVHRRVCEKL